MAFTSDELNYLIYRYLKEAGFDHSAFTFGNESRVSVDRVSVAPSDVLPGTLIYVVQKGLQYLAVESTITEDGNEVELEEPINLLTPYSVKRRNPEDKKKDKNKRKRIMSKKDQATMNVEEEPMGKKSATEKKTKTNSPTEIQACQVTKLEGHASEVFMCSWNPKKKKCYCFRLCRQYCSHLDYSGWPVWKKIC